MAYAKITIIGAMEYYEGKEENLFDFLELPEGLSKETLIDSIIYRAGDFELLHIDPPFTRYAIGAFSNKWYNTWDKWNTVLNMEYNPIHNYDRTEDITDKHTGTQDMKDTGTQTTGNTGNQTIGNTGTQTTANTGSQTKDNTGYQDNHLETEERLSGTDKVEETGTKDTTTTNTVSAFDSSNWSNHDKSDMHEVPDLETDTTYGKKTNVVSDSRRTDNLTETRTDALTQTRTDNLNETRTDNLDHLRTDNLTDKHDARIYGNIGVTTTQQMIESELELRRWNIYEQITDMFISEFCVMIY